MAENILHILYYWVKVIQKVSFVFYDTESVGLDTGKAVEMGIRIMLEKRSSALLLFFYIYCCPFGPTRAQLCQGIMINRSGTY